MFSVKWKFVFVKIEDIVVLNKTTGKHDKKSPNSLLSIKQCRRYTETPKI